MTYHYGRTGEPIWDDPTESSVTNVPVERLPIDNEIHARCEELRQILREARDRRQVAA